VAGCNDGGAGRRERADGGEFSWWVMNEEGGREGARVGEGTQVERIFYLWEG